MISSGPWDPLHLVIEPGLFQIALESLCFEIISLQICKTECLKCSIDGIFFITYSIEIWYGVWRHNDDINVKSDIYLQDKNFRVKQKQWDKQYRK